MNTVAAWILVLTLDAGHPQFQEFTTPERCEEARKLVVQRYNESQRERNQVWPVRRPGDPGGPGGPVLPPGNPGEVYATQNANCRPK